MRILHVGNDIGYMPFGYGHRLGANRYREDFLPQTETIVIGISNQTLRWPSFPNSYPAEEVVELPKSTLKTRFHPDGKDILWTLHQEDEGGSSSIIGGELHVGENEGETFRLVATADGQEMEFDCRIEYRPTVSFDNPSIRMEWSGTHGHVIIKFKGGIGNQFQTNAQSVSVYINGNRHPLPREQFKFVEPRPEYGIRGALTAQVEFPFSHIYLGEPLKFMFRSAIIRDNNLAVYSYEVEFSKDELLELLGLRDSIAIEATFDPSSITVEDLFATKENIITCKLMFNAANTSDHVQFKVETNIGTETVPGLLEESVYKLSQKKTQEIVLMGGNADVFVRVTPIVNGLQLMELSKSAKLNIQAPTPPMLGNCGPDELTWIQHVINDRGQQASDNDLERLLTMFRIESHDETVAESEHLRPQLDQIIHRRRYRHRAIPNDSHPDSNSDAFTSLLAELFPYRVGPGNPYLAKVRRDEQSANDFLNRLYVDQDLKIHAEFAGLTHLSPRQQFKIDFSDQNRSANEHVERTVFVMKDTTLRAVLNDNGKRLVANGGTEIELRSNFGYRTNSKKYTAPGTPGIYYLIEQENTKAYVFEIEVHGHEGGDGDE